MSFKVTKMNKKEIIAIPIAKYILVTTWGKESLNMVLREKYTIWQPSNKGMGIKLNNPTKSEIIINKKRIPFIWSSINWSAIFTIPIGPESSEAIVLLLIDWIK